MIEGMNHFHACLMLVGLLLFPIAGNAAGPLILIGGGSKPPAILKRFVEFAGGPDAPIVVIPTASGEPDTGEYYVKLFEESTGATRVTPLEIRTRLDAHRPGFVRALQEAGGIFFSGGDQSRITATFLGTPAYRAIRQAHQRGAVIGGTSAGTACMSKSMLNGQGDTGVLKASNIELVPGLGLWPNVILDQHFVARRRQARLLSVVLENPSLLGIGIDEATAAWVKDDGTMGVLGEGWVWIYDARKSHPRNEDGRLAVRDLKVQVLVRGDRFHLTTGEVMVPAEAP